MSQEAIEVQLEDNEGWNQAVCLQTVLELRETSLEELDIGDKSNTTLEF